MARTGLSPAEMDAGFDQLRLLPTHQDILRARAILPEVARERGVRSARTKAELGALWFAPQQRLTPSLVIPMHNTLGELANYAIRPDEPRIIRKKAAKYKPVKGSSLTVDVPLRTLAALRDPTRRLLVTEGPLKADAAVSHGADCIDIFGVWNWGRQAEILLPELGPPSTGGSG